MCGLCGIFGVGEHWTDSAGGGVLGKAERLHRVRIANAALEPFGLKLSDWMNRLTLSSLTGRTVVIDNFGSLWPMAERICGRPCDPLDPAVMELYERNGRDGARA